MLRALAVFCLLWLLAGCGLESPIATEPGHWQHCRIEGLKNAGGLAVFGHDLIAVAGGDDREIYVVSSDDLEPGGSVRARTLAVDITPKRPLMGAEPFALQDYEMRHLWAQKVDFQGAAVQAPSFLYVGDRIRRVIYWGRLSRDAAGRLARVKFDGITVAPGATRSKRAAGDWRDHGPGLAGLLALGARQRMEDLYVLERAPTGGPALRIYRMDRYGSPLGTIPIKQDLGAAMVCQALSWDGSRYVLLHGKGRGRIVSFKEPQPMRSVPLGSGVPGPDVEGVEAWTGMTHGEDGTIYLVSSGDPAWIAWRRP